MKTIWYNFDDDDFEYELDKYDVENEIKKCLKEYDRDDLVDLILKDDIIIDVLYDYFEENFKEDFEDEAREQYDNMIEEAKDPLGVRGLSLKDFL